MAGNDFEIAALSKGESDKTASVSRNKVFSVFF